MNKTAEEYCGYDACPDDGRCEYCQNPIIMSKTAEEIPSSYGYKISSADGTEEETIYTKEDMESYAQQEVARLNPLLEECLEAVRILSGEYQDGWDETIKKLEEVLNAAFYAQHIKPTK